MVSACSSGDGSPWFVLTLAPILVSSGSIRTAEPGFDPTVAADVTTTAGVASAAVGVTSAATVGTTRTPFRVHAPPADMSKLEAFLAGDRLDDVVFYVSDAFLDDDSRLREVGTETDGGVLLVLDGETGRSAFQAGTGMGAMEFAKEAMAAEGEIARSLDDGECPFAGDQAGDAGSDAADVDHDVRFVFAFAEGENSEVGGLYAEGDVIHAYAHCTCGESYSRKWVVGDRA